MDKDKEHYRVQWTDGKIGRYTERRVRSMLYDPVAYVYDFQL